jgi:CRP/FNR family transcriptional regulator, anaerobic regulatory protein
MINSFTTYLNGIHPVSPEAIQELLLMISVQRLPKNAIVLVEGQVQDRLLFLEKGLARAFYYDGDKEYTSWILAENEFVISVSSFFQQKPSTEIVQLLEDATIVSLSWKDFDYLCRKYPEITYIALKITERYLLLFDNRTRFLRLSAKDRYLKFEQQHKHILLRLQIHHIASFLGLARSSISALRAEFK